MVTFKARLRSTQGHYKPNKKCTALKKGTSQKSHLIQSLKVFSNVKFKAAPRVYLGS